MGQNWRIIVMALLVGIFLPACQPQPIATPTLESSPIPTQNATTIQMTQEVLPYVPPAQEEPSLPAPGSNSQTYPQPGQEFLGVSPYPGPSQGVTNTLEWAAAEELITGGQVARIYQASTMHVTLELKDGSIALTLEPAPDEVVKVIERCGEPCSDIEQVKE